MTTPLRSGLRAVQAAGVGTVVVALLGGGGSLLGAAALGLSATRRRSREG